MIVRTVICLRMNQHPYRWETHLPLAADVVTDEIAGAKQQLPHAVQDRARTRPQAPNVHHDLAHALPPDAPQTCTLRTGRAIVAREGERAVVAAVLLLALDYRIGSRCQLLKRAYCSLTDCQLILISIVNQSYKSEYKILFHCKSREKTIKTTFHRSKTENQPIILTLAEAMVPLFLKTEEKKDSPTDHILNPGATTAINPIPMLSHNPHSTTNSSNKKGANNQLIASTLYPEPDSA